MPSTAAERPQTDWEFPVEHEAAWTWPSDKNPHGFEYMEGVIPFRSPKGEIKECPNCHRTVRFSIGMCPLCGYDEEDWQVPEHLAALVPGENMPQEGGEPWDWGDWVPPNAMEKLRGDRPHPMLECHNCHTKGGMIFDPLNEWARCDNCGSRTPVSGDMPIQQKFHTEDAWHEDPETGEPLTPGEAFQPASPDVAWPALDHMDFGPRHQGKRAGIMDWLRQVDQSMAGWVRSKREAWWQRQLTKMEAELAEEKDPSMFYFRQQQLAEARAYHQQHVAAAWDNYQDPRKPFVDQAGQYHSQCEQCGELIDGPVCGFCGHQQTTQDPQTLLNHQPRGPMDQAGDWTFPEHWSKTAIRNPFGDDARRDRRKEKFDKSYQKYDERTKAESLARDAEKTPPLLKGLWDAAYHHNVAPESLYLNHTYGEDGKSWYSTEPQVRDYYPGWSNHLQAALKNLGPEWYANWHQQYQQQKAQEHAANPDSMSHEHEDWLDWYAQQAPEHFDPHAYDPSTTAPRPTPPEAHYQVRDRLQRQQEPQQPQSPQSVQPKPYQPDQSMIFNNPSPYSRTTTKEAGPVDWANRFLSPEFKPQPENMRGLAGHCYFHPDRPAVAHEGYAAMCVDCLERYRAAQQAVGQR